MQYVTAAAGVVLAIAVLRSVAHRIGLIDHPGGRRQHQNPVPLVGGLAIGFGLALALIMRGNPAPAPPALMVSALIVIASGTIDDRVELSARIKLLQQVIAACVLIEFGGPVLTHLGALFSTAQVKLHLAVAVPFTILGVVGVMNAMNMIDGADGLAGGITMAALFWFAIAASNAGMSGHAMLLGLIASAVGSYLLFNAGGPLARRFKVFLGDAGSMLLGLLLAWTAIELTMSPFTPLKPVTAVWILAVPICDSVSLMLRRMLRRRSPFAPDREHFHHLLQEAGLTSGQAVMTMLMIGIGFGGLAMFAEHLRIPEHLMFWISMAIFVAFTWGSASFFALRRKAHA